MRRKNWVLLAVMKGGDQEHSSASRIRMGPTDRPSRPYDVKAGPRSLEHVESSGGPKQRGHQRTRLRGNPLTVRVPPQVGPQPPQDPNSLPSRTLSHTTDPQPHPTLPTPAAANLDPGRTLDKLGQRPPRHRLSLAEMHPLWVYARPPAPSHHLPPSSRLRGTSWQLFFLSVVIWCMLGRTPKPDGPSKALRQAGCACAER